MTAQVYYRAKKQKEKDSRVYNDGYDDENYDYKVKMGEVLNDRYVVKSKIGKGSFGQVVEALDRTLDQHVAVKIIKSKKPFYQQALTEIELLKYLNEKDNKDQFKIVRLLDTFETHRHQCLVFEMLSMNLYDLLRNTHFHGVSLNLIRKFANQILKALAFLALPEVNIIHCDLKPENILLKHQKKSGIKVIDFGSSCRADKQLYTYIQSRFYRSPEVMLGRKYDVAIDMWSLGCILVEMHVGEPLFGGTDEFDQMRRLCLIKGVPPVDMLLEGKPEKVKNFFDLVPFAEAHAEAQACGKSGVPPIISAPVDRHRARAFLGNGQDEGNELDDDDEVAAGGGGDMEDAAGASSSSSSGRYVFRLKTKTMDTRKELEDRGLGRTIADIVGVETGGPNGRRRDEPHHGPDVYRQYLHLVERMLDYNPSTRVKPIEAMKHPFFSSGPNSAVGHAAAGGHHHADASGHGKGGHGGDGGGVGRRRLRPAFDTDGGPSKRTGPPRRAKSAGSSLGRTAHRLVSSYAAAPAAAAGGGGSGSGGGSGGVRRVAPNAGGSDGKAAGGSGGDGSSGGKSEGGVAGLAMEGKTGAGSGGGGGGGGDAEGKARDGSDQARSQGAAGSGGGSGGGDAVDVVVEEGGGPGSPGEGKVSGGGSGGGAGDVSMESAGEARGGEDADDDDDAGDLDGEGADGRGRMQCEDTEEAQSKRDAATQTPKREDEEDNDNNASSGGGGGGSGASA